MCDSFSINLNLLGIPRGLLIGLFVPVFGSCLWAQEERSRFAGIVTGVSTLSADAQSQVQAQPPAFSSYKPENGLAVNLFGGAHLGEYLSLQGNYVWNRNRLTLTSASVQVGEPVLYEQIRESQQHSAIADVLLYFRNRRSWVRPYLSAGVGLVHFQSRARGVSIARGAPELPPASFSSDGAALRVAVGIDVRVVDRWAVRYSFSETLRGNPISRTLTPPGERNLANFQNLAGLVWSF